MSNPDNVIAAVVREFTGVARPAEFIKGTCRCEECMEHNDTMAAHTPADITIKELGNPAWDPLCFVSDEAFVYYLPAMIRLAFEDEYYIDQLLFHMDNPGRLSSLSNAQAKVLSDALVLLGDIRSELISNSFSKYSYISVMDKLKAKSV